MSSDRVPSEFAHAVITGSVHCRRCGYDLQGLRADSQCPECGLGSWLTVQHTVDPEGSRFPRLGDPRAVGNGFLWLTLCLLGGLLALLLRPVALQLEAIDVDLGDYLPVWVLRHAVLGAAIIALTGLYSVYALAPSARQQTTATVWRDVGLLAIGLVVFAALAAGLWWYDGQALRSGLGLSNASVAVQRSVVHVGLAVAAIATLVATRNMLATIGSRSREYRTSKGGRQRIRDMIAAIIAVGVGEVVRVIGALIEMRPSSVTDVENLGSHVRALGTVVIWVSLFMLVIGMGYLVRNAWWIRRALRRPAPNYGQILLPPLPADTTISTVDEQEPFEVLARGETPHGAPPPDAARGGPTPPDRLNP